MYGRTTAMAGIDYSQAREDSTSSAERKKAWPKKPFMVMDYNTVRILCIENLVSGYS